MKNILVTGATGFIGSLLVKEILDKRMFDNILLPVRNMNKVTKMYGMVPKHTGKLHFIESSLMELNSTVLPVDVDYIIHCASVTQSIEMVTYPVETADSIVLGTRSILELARQLSIKSMVYLSSMEVYGRVADTARRRRIRGPAVRSCAELLSIRETDGGALLPYLSAGIPHTCKNCQAGTDIWQGSQGR